MTDFEFEKPKKRSGTNLHSKDVDCATCDGERFVVVANRPVKQSSWMQPRGIVPPADGIEEYAPCPSCHSALDTEFFRYDGTPVRSPDPALVRQRALPVSRRSGVRRSAPESVPQEVIDWMRANGIPVKVA